MSSQILEEAYQRVDFDREIVYRFFIMFSLFEYALKNAGFRKKPYIGVEPDWDAFAQDIDNSFMTLVNSDLNSSLYKAVEYILSDPPGKQVYRDNRLQFIPRTRDNNLCPTGWLSLLIT